MSNKNSGISFFQKILGSLFNSKDAEAEKKRQLKIIAKNLSKTRYKFYKPGADQVLPAFGKFFYDMYKLIAPCQLMFNAQQNPNAYKNLVIDSYLSESQKKILDELTEESIVTQSASISFDQLKQKIKTGLEKLSADFDQDKIQSIDTVYSKMMCFKQLCQYDYYFMLKKFDSSLKEQDFSKTPKFNPIDASYIADDLKDFLSIAWTLPFNTDWSDVMQIFKNLKGVEPIKPSQWTKLVSRLEQLHVAGVFEMIIQLTTKDPAYIVNAEVKREQIVEAYIDKVRNQATSTIRKLENEQKNSKTASLLTQIFNTTGIFSLKYYTEQAGEPLRKKNLPDYEYYKPLNYMKAFLLEYVKRDVREYADLVIIRGKWSTAPLSQQMSDAFHALLDTSDKITAFDARHSEENGDIGSKIKTLLPRADRDKEAANIIRTTLKDSNALAREYVVSSTKNLILFAKNTKALIEDYKKPHGELITNWKELDRFAEHPIEELAVEVYKKIYLLVNLMQTLLQ